MQLQSSSGYGGLDTTPLSRPGYYNEIIARVYERDFLPEITNGDISERILYCNQQVQIMIAPGVGPWRTYQKNQEMVANQVTADAICLSICNAAYNAIKIDKLDIFFACERWSAWEEKFLDAAYESYVSMQREWVLAAMVLEAASTNKGAAAGKFANIDLGSRGNPITVNKDNIPLHLAHLQQVLMEQLRWKEGEMFVVMPIAFRPVLAMSNFANNSWTGNCKPCSFGIDGLWDVPLGGFNVYETTHAPYVIESDGKVCFYIIAGHRSAFAYVSDIIEGRLVEMDRTFGVEYQMLAVWGGKMIYPTSIAVAYWTFNTN